MTYGTLTMSLGNQARTVATSGAAQAGIGEGQAQESMGWVGAATRRHITAPMVEQGPAVATAARASELTHNDEGARRPVNGGTAATSGPGDDRPRFEASASGRRYHRGAKL